MKRSQGRRVLADKRIMLISGARPNFMKIAPLLRALDARPGFTTRLVHTGQHYDEDMAQSFFRDLGMRPPDIDLEVGSASHAVQTGRIMILFDELLDREHADLVLVVGDVNSTIACALVAVKRGIPVAHVEAGLRSRDRAMPEEINRILTDSISDLLFTTEESAAPNLRAEGIAAEKIHFAGNVMVDTLFHHRREAAGIPLPAVPEPFALVTLHRPSNVDDPASLQRAVSILADSARTIPLVFPVHPRTAAKLRETGLRETLENTPGVHLLPPANYLTFVRLLLAARVVLTDSGGIQEESTALGIPCITLRENTERPITVSEGTNEVCGLDRKKIATVLADILQGRGKSGRIPKLWDGKAAERIADTLAVYFDERS
ncbi:MAG: UDP-N-acetylglucosamine 2-epimerase (non-hydrolyzing) [Gemmatimonadetes bacterium]|nr:UDP-N-acetylglucosamine 2-epimerase (non-hydrolyzing) [Gemmatimonadota bacterium]